MNEIISTITNQSELITKCYLMDTFVCSEEQYLKIRRGELKRKAQYKHSLIHPVLDKFYPYSKKIMEKLYGGVYIR